MTKLLTIILTIISITVTAQSTDCGCYNGIGSTETDRPSLTIEFSNGTTLTVCGYEQEKLNENEVLISEFNVFNCKTGESLVEYGAVQNCIVKKDDINDKNILSDGNYINNIKLVWLFWTDEER